MYMLSNLARTIQNMPPTALSLSDCLSSPNIKFLSKLILQEQHPFSSKRNRIYGKYFCSYKLWLQEVYSTCASPFKLSTFPFCIEVKHEMISIIEKTDKMNCECRDVEMKRARALAFLQIHRRIMRWEGMLTNARGNAYLESRKHCSFRNRVDKCDFMDVNCDHYIEHFLPEY